MADWDLVVIGDLKTPKDYQLERGATPARGPGKIRQGILRRDRLELHSAAQFRLLHRRTTWAPTSSRWWTTTTFRSTAGARTSWSARRSRSITTKLTCRPSIPIGATNHSEAVAPRLSAATAAQARTTARKTRKRVHVDIQADFWNGDPDIDAVCRMEHAPECDFDPAAFPIASNRLSPFNSQNTFLAGADAEGLFPLSPRRPHGRHLGRLLRPGQGLSRRLRQGVGLPGAQRSRSGARHEAGISRLREQSEPSSRT